MEIFRLFPGGSTWSSGEVINGIKTKLWVERYRSAGEFKFTCIPTRDIRAALPVGALISHTNTLTVMMVENHETIDTKGKESILTITGRSIDSFLENRVATDDRQGFNPSLYDGTAFPYQFNTTDVQHALKLIRNQIEAGFVERNSFALPSVHVSAAIVEIDPTTEDHEVKRGPLYSAVLDVLSDIGAGLRIDRPADNRTDIYFTIHKGVNRKGTVQFKHDAGDLETARYFTSNKTDKDSAYVASRFWGMFYTEGGTHTGFNRRVAYIDASDLNANPAESGPYGFITAAKIERIMTRRARRIIARRQITSILEATISKNSKYQHRRDYNVGDIVYVIGNYDTSDAFRIVEYVETDDEKGTEGFPTLVRAPGF